MRNTATIRMRTNGKAMIPTSRAPERMPAPGSSSRSVGRSPVSDRCGHDHGARGAHGVRGRDPSGREWLGARRGWPDLRIGSGLGPTVSGDLSFGGKGAFAGETAAPAGKDTSRDVDLRNDAAGVDRQRVLDGVTDRRGGVLEHLLDDRGRVLQHSADGRRGLLEHFLYGRGRFVENASEVEHGARIGRSGRGSDDAARHRNQRNEHDPQKESSDLRAVHGGSASSCSLRTGEPACA